MLNKRYCPECKTNWSGKYCPLHGIKLMKAYVCSCGEEFLFSALYCMKCGKSKEERNKELTTTPAQNFNPTTECVLANGWTPGILEKTKNNIIQ